MLAVAMHFAVVLGFRPQPIKDVDSLMRIEQA